MNEPWCFSAASVYLFLGGFCELGTFTDSFVIFFFLVLLKDGAFVLLVVVVSIVFTSFLRVSGVTVDYTFYYIYARECYFFRIC